jgi:FAD/FMN-containing dehydrogenase
VACGVVEANWTSGIFHSERPESVDYPIYANNSCLPPGSAGFDPTQGCHLGGLPEYIVNATTENQVASAVKWAADRNIRVVVKGTGHDLNGRYPHGSINK